MWQTASIHYPDSKVHEANMGTIWGRQDPVGPHVGPMNFAIWAHVWLINNTPTAKHYIRYISIYSSLKHTDLLTFINIAMVG